MNMFDIRTTLNIRPTVYTGHEMIYISKGASATLNFDFSKEIYSFEDTDQVTFIFKQGAELHWYKMFTYLSATSDEQPVPGKTYYTELTPIEKDSLQCTALKVENPETPRANGYFEEVDGNHSWRDTQYIVDPHFVQSSGESWDYISLVLRPEDTNKFKPTAPGMELAFEVAIRLNTDGFGSLGNTDSIIIEPQHPIAVIDSLYSKLI
jgi:hypothetical protein